MEENIRLSCLSAVGTLEVSGIMFVWTSVSWMSDVGADATLIFFIVALVGDVVEAGA